MDAERSTWNIGAPAGWRQDTPRPRERAQYHPPRDLLAPSTVDRPPPHPGCRRSGTCPPPDRLDTRARPRLSVSCDHTGRPRVALRGPGRPGHWPIRPAVRAIRAVGPSPDDRRGSEWCSTWNRGGRRRAHREPVFHVEHANGRATKACSPGKRAAADPVRTRERPAGPRPGRLQLRAPDRCLPIRPRRGAAERDDQALGQPVLDRLPSGSRPRAPGQPAPPPRRRAGVLLPGARPGVCPASAAAPAARSVRGIPLLSRPARRAVHDHHVGAGEPRRAGCPDRAGVVHRVGPTPPHRASTMSRRCPGASGRAVPRGTALPAGESAGLSAPTSRPTVRTAVAWRARRRDAGTDRGTDG